MFFHLCEVVQIFQRESIFCNKISSGGSLFIKKLVPGGTNFGGSIFTMTQPIVLTITRLLMSGCGQSTRLLGSERVYGNQ